MINGIKQPSSYYAFLICQKPVVAVDEEYFQFDDEVLEENILVEPFEYNRVYMFTYRSAGDSSGFKKVLPVEQIASLLVKESHGEYKLKIEMSDGNKYSFVFQCAYECLLWVRGLRKSIQVQEEILRSNFGLIKYNIAILYKQYEARELGLVFEVVDALFSDLVLSLDADRFLGQFLETIREINFFCDAFFAFKPFVANFFEIIIKRVHLAVRARVCEFWNLRLESLNPGQILCFGKHANTYRETMVQWGLADEKFLAFNRPVIRTFCSRLFESSREIMFNVVEEALFKFKKAKQLFRNDATKILEAHMNICFENYNQFPTLETARELALLVASMVGIVQMNIITQVTSRGQAVENEVLASLANNSFESLVRNFVKKVHFKTKSELNLREIRGLVNYAYLLRNSERLGQVCMDRLVARVLGEIRDLAAAQRKDLLFFRVEKLIREIDLLYRDIIFGFQNEFEKYNLVERVGHEVVRIYFEKLVAFLPNICHENYQMVLAKIEADRLKLLAFFRPLVSKELDPVVQMLHHLEQFFRRNDTDFLRVAMFKIVAFFGAEYAQEQHVEQVFRAKIYLSRRQTEKLIAEFRGHTARSRASRRLTARQSRVILTRMSLKKVVRQFKKLLRKERADQFATALGAYKSNTADLLEKSFVIGDIFRFKADCRMVKFPQSIEELEIEAFVDNYVKRGSM